MSVIRKLVRKSGLSRCTSITAAGILVTDFPGENEPFALTTDAHVDRNTAFGNSSDAAGPVDLWVASIEELASVSRNSCGSSIPDPAWCDG